MCCFSFFASYSATGNFTYVMGNFAQMSLPLTDSVTLTVQRLNRLDIENVTVSLELIPFYEICP